MRYRIDIEKRVETQDPDTGAIVVTWEPVCRNIAASIEPLSVREFISSAALQSEITTRIVIRHRKGLDASMRIVHQGKIYNPAGWLPDHESGKDYLTAPCREGVNQG